MKKQTPKTKSIAKIKEPKRDRELPVTKRLLDLTKQELKGDITSLRLEMKAGFTKIDTRFHGQDAKISNLDAKISNLDAKLDAKANSLDAKMDSLKLDVAAQISSLDTKITKMMILMEDQNDRNRATMDANAAVYERIIDNDARFEKLEEHVFGIKQR